MVYHVHVCILVIAVDDNMRPYDIDEQPPFTGNPNKPDFSSGGRVCLTSRLTVQK